MIRFDLDSCIDEEIIAEWKNILFHPSDLKYKNSLYNKVFWGNFIAYLTEGNVSQNAKLVFLDYCLDAEDALNLFETKNHRWWTFCDFIDDFIEFCAKDEHKITNYANYLSILDDTINTSNLYQNRISDDDIDTKIICTMLYRMMNVDNDKIKCMSDPDVLQEAYAIITS